MKGHQMVSGSAGKAGQAAAQTGGKLPDGPAAAGRTGQRAELGGLGGLRERMRSLGFGCDEVAAEIGRRYPVRPREAYRLAWGWTLDHAAARFSEQAGREGTDPQTPAALTGPHLGEYEKWPHSTRKPPADVLVMLAQMYQTDVLSLLDLADHESLPQQDRLVLLRRPRAATPFGEKVVALMEALSLSAAGTARRVPCSPGYLSNVIHGRKQPSRRVAARLDDLLQAGGELAALAETAEIITSDSEPPPPRTPPGPAADTQVPAAGGLSLSLPYVPARLVIEVSGPAGETALLTYDGNAHTVTGGRLALVPGTGGTGSGEAEVTGA
jgi:transcriptional regulator with XRE-family HTH domain